MTMTSSETGGTTAVVRKIVYTVTERGERSFWTRIGAAFINRDGSMTVRLDAMPMNGTLQIRDDEPGRRAGGAQ